MHKGEETTPWTSDIEILLAEWSEYVKYKMVIYEQSTIYYENCERLLGIPIIILGVLTTSSIIVDTDQNYEIQRVVSAILSIILTVLTALSKFAANSELAMRCSDMSAQYNKLSLLISGQLALPIEYRDSAPETLKHIRDKMCELRNGPTIPLSVFKSHVHIKQTRAFQTDH